MVVRWARCLQDLEPQLDGKLQEELLLLLLLLELPLLPLLLLARIQ